MPSLFDLIPLPVRIGLLVAAVVGSLVAGWTVRGMKADADIGAIKEQIAKEREDAATAARDKETMWQEVVNGTVRNYETKMAGIRGNLDAALDELRQRPERAAGAGENPRPACTGATGAELSRADAEFLAREAARADQQRAGLVACYEVIDGLRR